MILRILIVCCLTPMMFGFAQDVPESQVKTKLDRFLKRFPDSDSNKDGTLEPEEFRRYRAKRKPPAKPSNIRRNAPPPTHREISYGDHAKQRFDLWLVPGAKSPTPLVIFIHGGGFRGGDKSALRPGMKEGFLKRGVAFASMNYRLSDVGPYPIMMHDAARGLQTLRHRAPEWNIDPNRIVCFGGSAGAGISLWLAFHDDLADPNSHDPIARESTRVHAVGAMNGQSTYDLQTYRDWFGVPNLPMGDAMAGFFGIESEADLAKPAVKERVRDASPIVHLSRDDRVSVYMTYSHPNSKVHVNTPHSAWVHHPLLGLKLKEAMEKIGLNCYVSSPNRPARNDPYGSLQGFLIAQAKGGS